MSMCRRVLVNLFAQSKRQRLLSSLIVFFSLFFGFQNCAKLAAVNAVDIGSDGGANISQDSSQDKVNLSGLGMDTGGLIEAKTLADQIPVNNGGSHFNDDKYAIYIYYVNSNLDETGPSWTFFAQAIELKTNLPVQLKAGYILYSSSAIVTSIASRRPSQAVIKVVDSNLGTFIFTTPTPDLYFVRGVFQ